MKSSEIQEIYPSPPYPLSLQLLNFIDNNSDFNESLKLTNTKRFIFLPIIICSFQPNYKDEIIGMFYYDKQKQFFKQDYVVNVNFEHKFFVSYSRMSKDITETENSKGIDTFFIKYGEWDNKTKAGKFYCRDNHKKTWMHHYTFDDLPDELKTSAKDILIRYNPE